MNSIESFLLYPARIRGEESDELVSLTGRNPLCEERARVRSLIIRVAQIQPRVWQTDLR